MSNPNSAQLGFRPTRKRSNRGSNDAALNLVIAFSAAIGLAIVLFREQIIPLNFSYDGLKIQAIASGQISGYGDSSYESVAWLYSALGLSSQPLLASILGYGLYLYSVALVRVRHSASSNLATLMVLYPSSIVLGAIYLGFYSKDIFVTPIVLVCLFYRFSKRAEFVAAVLMAVYAMNFRSYWLLVLVLFVVFRLVNFLRFSRAQIFWFLTLTSLALSAGVYFIIGADPDHYREMVNSVRLGSSDATTAIPSFVNFEQPFAGAINNWLTFWFLFMPLPLLQLGQIAYYVIFVVIALIWVLTIRAVESSRQVGSLEKPLLYSFYLLMAFVCVQAVFEPDFGSALRHLTPLTPFMLLVATVRIPRSDAHAV